MSTQLTGSGADVLTASVGTRLDGSPLLALLDIDGTLAPIAPRPDEAGIPAATADLLRRFVRLPGVSLAFITGRMASDARGMVDVDGTWIIGTHGFELTTPHGETIVSPEAEAFEPVVHEAQGALEDLSRGVPGVVLENKRWSLAVHYRLADPNAVQAVIARVNDVARTLGLRVTDGKMMVELRPPLAIDKGTAAVALAEQLDATGDHASLFNAGDDRTDEDAFEALRQLNPRAVTVRVKGAGEEVSVDTHAEFVLASTDELRRALEWLVARRSRLNAAG